MKNKTSFALVIGLVLGFAAGQIVPRASAVNTEITGGSGFLKDYDVIAGGKTICSEPFVFVKTKEIECD